MHTLRVIEGQINVTLKIVICTLFFGPFLARFSGTQGPFDLDSAKNYEVPSQVLSI